MSRAAGRMQVFARALPRFAVRGAARLLGLRRKPEQVQRILIAHHLLLGDTLMLTTLLAKLRAAHPAATIAMTCPEPFVELYSGRPYGVEALPFDPRRAETVRAVLASGPYDIAFVPGDNRHAWLALAAGSRWIVAHAGDVPAWKNWPVDEAAEYPEIPMAWSDMAAQLAEGPAPAPYRPAAWPMPAARPFVLPQRPYVVLHPGASTPLKHWPAERWAQLADWIAGRGVQPVWSAGAKEVELVAAADPRQRYPSYAGRLDLLQMAQLIAKANALVCPDTGIAHLGRVVGVPTLALFGPGSSVISGAGEFWRDCPYVALTEPDFPCRDQKVLFRRRKDWIRRCGRSTSECSHARCMDALDFERAQEALQRLTPTRGGQRSFD